MYPESTYLNITKDYLCHFSDYADKEAFTTKKFDYHLIKCLLELMPDGYIEFIIPNITKNTLELNLCDTYIFGSFKKKALINTLFIIH